MKYRVVVPGGMDGVLFDDLYVTYSSGHKFQLHVKQGDCIPVEIFDPLDIQKSLVVGSLGNYIKAGIVKVEYSDLEKNNKKRKPQQKKEEITQQPTQLLQPSVEAVQPVQQKPEETLPPMAQDAPTDLKDIKVADDFFKLSFFNRLKFIQNCNDKSVLTELLENPKLDSTQIKNNLVYRLETLG